MSQFFLQSTHQNGLPLQYPSANAPTSNSHHGSRRRTPRFASSQFSQKHSRARVVREVPEVSQANTFSKDFEAARSFELEDDELFCPWHLLTEDDVSAWSLSNGASFKLTQSI